MKWIFAIFAVIGALDRVFGNRFKLGQEFEKGISTCGSIILAMSGMIVLSPIIADGISYAFKPILSYLNMDLSVMASFLVVDAGGAEIARKLSSDTLISGYNGIIVASMFGATICPGIPLSLQMVDKKHHGDVLTGLLCGFATIPFGCIIGGIIAGCNILSLLKNSIFIIVLSAIICVGLVKCPDIIKKIFSLIGKILYSVLIIGLAIGIYHQLTETTIVQNTAPLNKAFLIIGEIVIILAGILPMLAILSKLLKPILKWLGNAMGIGEVSVMGLVTSLANYIPMFSMVNDMNKKGRIVNMAFLVSGAFAFGDHLAFTLSFDSSFALPMVVGKLISGILAIILASFIYKKQAKD